MASKDKAQTFELPRLKVAGKTRAYGASGTNKKGDKISRNDRYDKAKQSSATVRSRTSVNEVIKELATSDGIFSAAVNAAVTISTNKGYKVAGFDDTGVMSLDVMDAAYRVLDMLDGVNNYEAFADESALRSVIDTLTIDVVTTGGCGLELVLDETMLPRKLVPIPYSTLSWQVGDDGERYPVQDDNDNDLNIPTVFVGEHMRQASEAYATSMLRPGIELTFMYTELLEDVRRALRQTGNPRILAKLDAEKVRATMPDSVKNNPEKSRAWMEEVYQQVADTLSDMEPEDAAIFWDSVDVNVVAAAGDKADTSTLLRTMGNLFGTSVKSPASALGLRVEGGQGLSNSETLIYMKTIGAIPYTVCTVLSRAVTLAIRLMGLTGSVRISPNPVDLRTETELEAYAATKQIRVLKLLSLGLINEAQACFELDLRPNMLVNALAGTGFEEGDTAAAADANDPDRSTSAGAAANPGTPTKAGGESQ